MINGVVNLMRRPSITVTLIDSGGQDRTTEGYLDTGFSGDLTLPKSVINQLSLTPVGRSDQYRIGSGVFTSFNIYGAIIRWHDEVRHIDVLESEVFPVIGVGLLWDNNLSVDFRHGGDVTITELPDS